MLYRVSAVRRPTVLRMQRHRRELFGSQAFGLCTIAKRAGGHRDRIVPAGYAASGILDASCRTRPSRNMCRPARCAGRHGRRGRPCGGLY